MLNVLFDFGIKVFEIAVEAFVGRMNVQVAKIFQIVGNEIIATDDSDILKVACHGFEPFSNLNKGH